MIEDLPILPNNVKNQAISYVHPTSAVLQGDGKAALTPAQITQWRESGFALVDNLIPQALASAVIAESMEELNDVEDFGSGGALEFPTGKLHCDLLTLHENLIQASATLLQVPTSELRLIQSDIWAKKGPLNDGVIKDAYSNSDQRTHCDYGNNTLLHPPSWEKPEVVSMIVYLSDEEDCGGGTAVTQRDGQNDPAYNAGPIIQQPGYGGHPFFNNKDVVESYFLRTNPQIHAFRQSIYAREKRAKFIVGSVLLYRHDIWHRGTPLKPNKTRIVMNLGFKLANRDWITTWNAGWARKMYYGAVEKIIAGSSVAQRSVLGFPPPGNKYWNVDTIQAVAARYSPYGFDPTPYEAAL